MDQRNNVLPARVVPPTRGKLSEALSCVMRPLVKIAVVSSLLLLASLSAHGQTLPDELKQLMETHKRALEWRELTCTPSTGLICREGSCQAAQSRIELQLTRTGVFNGTLKRCDGDSCDVFPVSMMTGGLYTSIQHDPPRGAFLKIKGSDQFVEVVTLGLDAHVLTGACTKSTSAA
jgi:hypothetical protein